MRKERIFFVINETAGVVSLSNRPRQVLNLVLNVLSKFLNVDASWVHLTGIGNQDEVLAVSKGLAEAPTGELMAPGLRGVLEDRVGAGDDLVVIPDMPRDGGPGLAAFVKAGFGSMVVVPLVTGQARGTLGAMWRVTKGFDADYGLLLMVIGNLVGAALERATLYERLSGAEPGPDVKYDIEEFEKLVALAEQYSRATRLAISEAVVRAKGTASAATRPLEAMGAGMSLAPQGGGAPEDGDGEQTEGGGPAPEAGPLRQHERRMQAFVKLHPRG